MAYDETLAQRVRAILQARAEVQEKKMFGGLCFMAASPHGEFHMCCGITGGDLMVRVGPEQHPEALAQPHARPMDFTGRPMKGFVLVAPEGTGDETELTRWVEEALDFVHLRPPKRAKARRPRPRA